MKLLCFYIECDTRCFWQHVLFPDFVWHIIDGVAFFPGDHGFGKTFKIRLLHGDENSPGNNIMTINSFEGTQREQFAAAFMGGDYVHIHIEFKFLTLFGRYVRIHVSITAKRFPVRAVEIVINATQDDNNDDKAGQTDNNSVHVSLLNLFEVIAAFIVHIAILGAS